MIEDRDLRELLSRKATEMHVERTMPQALSRRVQRRRGLIALTGVAAAALLAVFAWTAVDSPVRSDAIPPSGRNVTEIDTPVAGQPPTAERLAGIWAWDDGGMLDQNRVVLRLSSDGTFVGDNSGQLDTYPAMQGTYEISGDTVRFMPDNDSDACVAGNNWTWRVGIQPDGRMNIVSLEDGDGNCEIGLGTAWSFTRVSPISPAASSLSPPVDGDSRAIDSVDGLNGLWLDTDTGRVLRFSWDMSYAIDGSGRLGTDDVEDAGAFALGANGTVRFTSGSDSSDCPEGSTKVWKNVRISSRTLQAVVDRDSCGDEAGTETTWILLGAPS
jgi:hypothetical protein